MKLPNKVKKQLQKKGLVILDELCVPILPPLTTKALEFIQQDNITDVLKILRQSPVLKTGGIPGNVGFVGAIQGVTRKLTKKERHTQYLLRYS